MKLSKSASVAKVMHEDVWREIFIQGAKGDLNFPRLIPAALVDRRYPDLDSLQNGFLLDHWRRLSVLPGIDVTLIERSEAIRRTVLLQKGVL